MTRSVEDWRTSGQPLRAISAATVSVVVPTYGRPYLLRRCLIALREQTRRPDEVIVVVRASDTASLVAINEEVWERVTVVQVDEPGVLAALRAGVGCSSGEIILFTDDDAEPHAEWLERLVKLLGEEKTGAAGGRDVIAGQTEPRQSDVGRITWFGKLIGNHHLGIGPPRAVDVLKGVNMGFRAECLAVPRPGVLRGDGAEVHFEVLCARWVRLLGWRVVYDPSIEVDHVGAERIGLDRRDRPAPKAVRDAAHNFLVATAALNRAWLPRQALYALALGSREAPGIGRGAAALVRGEREVLRRLGPSLAGSALATARLVGGLRGPLLASSAELRAARAGRLKAA